MRTAIKPERVVMKKYKESLFWIRVVAEYMIAFSILAFIIALPLGFTGFLSGYIGWTIVLMLLLPELDEETKSALKKWALKKTKREDA